MTATSVKSVRLRTPLMLAFRAAFLEKDARVAVDLRDESGDRIIASRRSSRRNATSESVIRREISTNIETLLNTINFESSFPLDDHQLVRLSILNFGLPDVTHRSIAENGVDEVAGEIEDALKRYEPRLISSSLKVERNLETDAASLTIRFIVRADMRMDPLKIPVEFCADIQMDSGKIAISRL